MPLRASKPPRKETEKKITTFVHDEASRRNIPTAEFEPLMRPEQQRPIRVAYDRRNRDLDPQLIWRGKYPDDDMEAEQPLNVAAPPLYIQEKVHPKVLIDDLKRETERQRRVREESAGTQDLQPDLFADFNGLPNNDARTEFYQHEQHWSNRMILGDSLQVMASLAEREALRGKVQCIYFDPPYGIKFNSNFQWSTTSRDVKDGNVDHITREPEQVKAFRDTWRDGIHSYLSYIRERLVVARDLLTESGSIFVQIGDENVHRVRAVMDEIFGDENFLSQIGFAKTSGSTDEYLGQTTDFLLWYARNKTAVKFRLPLKLKRAGELGGTNYNRARDAAGSSFSLTSRQYREIQDTSAFRVYSLDNLTSQSAGRDKGEGAASWFGVDVQGTEYKPSLSVRWKTNEVGMARLKMADRLEGTDKRLGYVRYLADFLLSRSTTGGKMSRPALWRIRPMSFRRPRQ